MVRVNEPSDNRSLVLSTYNRVPFKWATMQCTGFSVSVGCICGKTSTSVLWIRNCSSYSKPIISRVCSGLVGWWYCCNMSVKCTSDYRVQNDESLRGHCTDERRVRKQNIKVIRDMSVNSFIGWNSTLYNKFD